eukprot:gene21962-16413_t
MFWAFTLFDTVGDVRGGGGVATVVMTVAAPTLLVLGAEAWRRRSCIAGLRSADDATDRQGVEVSGAISAEDIEMTTASSQTEEIVTVNPMAAAAQSSIASRITPMNDSIHGTGELGSLGWESGLHL